MTVRRDTDDTPHPVREILDPAYRRRPRRRLCAAACRPQSDPRPQRRPGAGGAGRAGDEGAEPGAEFCRAGPCGLLGAGTHRDLDRDQRQAGADADREGQGGRDRLFRGQRTGAGHRPRHRPGAGPQPAGVPDHLWRQPYLDPWRDGGAGFRRRLYRGRACAGDPDHHPEEAGDDAGQLRGIAARRCDAEGHDPVSDRHHRHRRGHRLCGGIWRRGGAGAERRGAVDDLQNVDRVRRQDGPDRARRCHLSLPRRPPLRAGGRQLGRDACPLADPAHRRRRGIRPRHQP